MEKNTEKRKETDRTDQADFEWILTAYQKRSYKKGSRGIHMTLLQMGILMNRKKIQRLMRKFNLFCPIRKSKPLSTNGKGEKGVLNETKFVGP